MQTSYFHNKDIDFRNCVSIAYETPAMFKGRVEPLLAPSKELAKMNVSESKFEKLFFNERLQFINPRDIYERYKDAILLCWELPSDFCHRRIVAKWIEKTVGVIIPEFSLEPVEVQQTLF